MMRAAADSCRLLEAALEKACSHPDSVLVRGHAALLRKKLEKAKAWRTRVSKDVACILEGEKEVHEGQEVKVNLAENDDEDYLSDDEANEDDIVDDDEVF